MASSKHPEAIGHNLLSVIRPLQATIVTDVPLGALLEGSWRAKSYKDVSVCVLVSV